VITLRNIGWDNCVPLKYVVFLAGLLVVCSLLLEHVGRLEPCYLCLRERYVHLIIFLVGIGLLISRVNLTFARLILLSLWVFSTGLAGAHAGFEYGWWQLDVPCSGSGLPTSLTQMRSQLSLELSPRCDEPALVILGISLAGFNFIISLFMTLLLSLRPLAR